jgi:hypothetical protein
MAFRFISFHLCLLLGCLPSCLLAQFTTATPNGVIAANEYGVHTNGQNQQADGGTTYYMAWDATNLYVAFTGTNFNEAAVIYLDRNPVIPVNGGTNANGSLQGYFTYDRNHMMQPFRADFVLYYRNGYHEFRYFDGANYWGGQTSNTLAVGTNGGTNTVEIAIPWNTITQGAGRPAAFNWFTYKAYDYGAGTNGIYNSLPVGNPNCACNQSFSTLFPTRYYNVLNTANGSSTRPFSTTSFTYYQNNSAAGTGGFYLANSTFYDLTINDNSLVNTDNDPVNRLYDNNEISNRVLVDGTINITHDLYVGMGSALLPANNTGPAILATVDFQGVPGNVYNFGRIDANPEASGLNDWNNRRIDFRFSGTITLRQTPLFKDNWRVSNVLIPVGGSLLGPPADSLTLELQWGTFTNLGTMNLGDGSTGFCDLGLRGDWAHQNDYFFAGNGIWRVAGLLIGRNSSRLAPAPGSIVNLLVQRNFENYDEFMGKNGTARIDVTMAGRYKQHLMGNTTETTGAATTFHNLIIDNANLAGNFNNTADVWFESFGGGQINYFITGDLQLRNGDLVTRHRTTNVIHNLTLRDTATTTPFFVHSNVTSVGSSFVDGPLRYEVERSTLVSRGFPIGKTRTVLGVAIGDARPIGLQIDQNATTRTTYTAEMFLDDRSATYTWPSPIPELITWISQQRYWNISKGPGAGVDQALVTLPYDVIERHDGVNNAPALRIVKDDGAGNWINLTPLGPGGSANNTGFINSFPFTTFSDFTLASIDGNMPLPVEWQSFEALPDERHVDLDWRTAREVNTDRFVVERRGGGADWAMIGSQPAAGNASIPQAYTMEDHDVLPGYIYDYRIRQLDRNGAQSLSDVRSVLIGAESRPALALYPNPAHDQLHLLMTGVPADADMQVRIYDLRGREVLAAALRSGSRHTLDIHGLSPGVYLVKAQSGIHRVQQKLVVQ